MCLAFLGRKVRCIRETLPPMQEQTTLSRTKGIEILLRLLKTITPSGSSSTATTFGEVLESSSRHAEKNRQQALLDHMVRQYVGNWKQGKKVTHEPSLSQEHVAVQAQTGTNDGEMEQAITDELRILLGTYQPTFLFFHASLALAGVGADKETNNCGVGSGKEADTTSGSGLPQSSALNQEMKVTFGTPILAEKGSAIIQSLNPTPGIERNSNTSSRHSHLGAPIFVRADTSPIKLKGEGKENNASLSSALNIAKKTVVNNYSPPLVGSEGKDQRSLRSATTNGHKTTAPTISGRGHLKVVQGEIKDYLVSQGMDEAKAKAIATQVIGVSYGRLSHEEQGEKQSVVAGEVQEKKVLNSPREVTLKDAVKGSFPRKETVDERAIATSEAHHPQPQRKGGMLLAANTCLSLQRS